MLSFTASSALSQNSTEKTSYINNPYEINLEQLSDMADVFNNIDDENGNDLSSDQGLNGNESVKQRSSYSRKREASTSLSDDPKRKDQLRDSINQRLDVQELILCSVQRGNSNNVRYIVNENLSAQYLPNTRSEHFSDNSSKVQSSPEGCSTPEHAEDIGFSNACAENQSSSSSLSDLSIHSVNNSAGIQEHLNCLHLTDEGCLSIATDDVPMSPLYPSLFHRVPPTIYFANAKEKVYPLPPQVCKLLKWKLSTITPACVRESIERAGFHIVKGETSDWVGTWGKHMKCVSFTSVQDYQKVNHFPGSFHLGRKDKIWAIYSKMLARHDNETFSFFPETFVLPQDIRQLRQVWESEGPQKRWIIKPPASARGTGIKVINRWSQIPKKRPVVVQRYLNEPYLINGAKFDLRLYVLVPTYEPLRIYIFEDGLVRFASASYSTSVLSLNDPFMHLTNYSINRKNSTYTSNDDENTCQGHKWSLKSLWNYMKEQGVNTEKIREEIIDLIIKTIICSEGPMARLIRNYTKSRYNCFELYGFDIMLDKNLKPWLLEVNISPSLHTSSPLDTKIKCQLTKDMFNIVGFQVPDKVLKNICPASISSTYGVTYEELQNMCMNKSLHQWYLSSEEKLKQSTFSWKKHKDQDVLENLTPDDVRHLVASEDELCRAGSFIRVFPTNTTHRYLKYFERVRYYNILFNAWEQKYHDNRNEGISLLQSHCQKNFHLQTVFHLQNDSSQEV